jgi:hypothetical protein
LRARPKVGGKDERFRKYRISHFWLQTRCERNCGGQSLVTVSIYGRGEGYLGVLSIHGRRSFSTGWDIRRVGSCKTDLES